MECSFHYCFMQKQTDLRIVLSIDIIWTLLAIPRSLYQKRRIVMNIHLIGLFE